MKRRPTKSSAQPDLSLPLFLDWEAVSTPEATSLSLVENPRPASPPEPSPLDSQNSQTPKVHKFPQRGGGLPDSQTRRQPLTFDSSEEARYPSRVNKERVQPRLNRNLLQKVRVECASRLPKPIDLQDAIEDGLRLWLRAVGESRHNSQTPTSSSSSSSGLEIDLTTTTTTVDSQPRKVLLPGVASAIAELKKLPHESKFDFEIIHAYAWESHRKGEGINTPDVWAVSNYRTGKHDALIEMWMERKRTEEEEAGRIAAARAEREARERQECERVMEEMRIRDEQRSLQESQEAARKEAERAAAEEEHRHQRAELDKRVEKGLAEGKKLWQIT